MQLLHFDGPNGRNSRVLECQCRRRHFHLPRTYRAGQHCLECSCERFPLQWLYMIDYDIVLWLG